MTLEGCRKKWWLVNCHEGGFMFYRWKIGENRTFATWRLFLRRSRGTGPMFQLLVTAVDWCLATYFRFNCLRRIVWRKKYQSRFYRIYQALHGDAHKMRHRQISVTYFSGFPTTITFRMNSSPQLQHSRGVLGRSALRAGGGTAVVSIPGKPTAKTAAAPSHSRGAPFNYVKILMKFRLKIRGPTGKRCRTFKIGNKTGQGVKKFLMVRGTVRAHFLPQINSELFESPSRGHPINRRWCSRPFLFF